MKFFEETSLDSFMWIIRQDYILLIVKWIVFFYNRIWRIVCDTFFRTNGKYLFIALYLVLEVKPRRLIHLNAFGCEQIDIKWFLALKSNALHFQKLYLGMLNNKWNGLLYFVFLEERVHDSLWSVVYHLLVHQKTLW